MADQNSARPTGSRAPWAWSGQNVKRMNLAELANSKLAVSSFLALIALVHTAIANTTTGDASNALWPTLILGYAVIIFTLVSAMDAFIPAQSNTSYAPANKNTTPSPASPLAVTQRAPSVRPGQSCLDHDVVQSDWTDLMSQVSHELRTPLNAVIGFSDLMNAEILGPLENPRYREYLLHIRNSGQDLLKSAEDTLAMTSLLTQKSDLDPTFHTCNLNAVIQKAWGFVSAEASTKSITCKIKCHSQLSVFADARPLRQTFVNLLKEAIARADEQSTVTIKASQFGEVVDISVQTQSKVAAPLTTAEGSLHVAIARALLELQGTSLATHHDDGGAWQAVTRFDCPLQTDFFNDVLHDEHIEAPSEFEHA